MRATYRAAVPAAVLICLAGSGTGVAAAVSSAADPCATAIAPIFQVVNPTSQASLVTPSRIEADRAKSTYGFTVDNGVIFQAPATGTVDLNDVVRLYHPTSGDFLWTADATEAQRAVDNHGYQRQQTDFAVSATQLACTTPVNRLLKGTMHRLAVGSAVATLTAAGWTNEGVKFHAFGASTLPLSSVLASGVLGNATYTFSDFTVLKEEHWVGAALPRGGLTGQGEANSIIRMDPMTSTKAGEVPPRDSGEVNPMDMLMLSGTAGSMASPTFSGFTLQGTPQGHVYNGLRTNYTRGARFSHVKVVAVPGDYHINPGETFGINDWQGHGNTYTDIEVDGAGVGASAIALNSSEDPVVTRAHVHDNRYSAGVAAWQTTNVTLTDVRTIDNRTGLNFERVSGTVVITRPTILGNPEQDIFIGSDWGSATYTIIDPVLAAGAKLRIRLPATELGSPNKQRREDIKVIVDGADVTATLVHWL